MEPIERIFVIIDSDMRMTAGLHRAAQIARRAGVELYLLMCAHEAVIDMRLEIGGTKVQDLAREQYLEQRRHWLNERTAELAASGIQVECEVLWTPTPHEAVLARALVLAPGLIIKDLMPNSGAGQRMRLGSFDWRLARISPVPLMFVRQDGPPLPLRIAAAVDTSIEASGQTTPVNDRIAAVALQIALFASADLHAVQVFPYRQPTASLNISTQLRTLYLEARQASLDNFRAFCARHSVPEDHRRWIEDQGETGPALIRYTQEYGIDLLVLGSTYHSAFSRLLLGSVSEQVLGHCDCDVLLVKPADVVEELARHYDFRALRGRYGIPDG